MAPTRKQSMKNLWGDSGYPNKYGLEICNKGLQIYCNMGNDTMASIGATMPVDSIPPFLCQMHKNSMNGMQKTWVDF